MPLPELFVESLGERDIDLVLLEELNASSDFRFWWLQQVHIPEPCAWEFMGVWHSVSHPTLGESDIVLLVRQLHTVMWYLSRTRSMPLRNHPKQSVTGYEVTLASRMVPGMLSPPALLLLRNTWMFATVKQVTMLLSTTRESKLGSTATTRSRRALRTGLAYWAKRSISSGEGIPQNSILWSLLCGRDTG